MTTLTAIRERLARDHMNHGCDTWPEHMRDCEALLEVAEKADLVYREARGEPMPNQASLNPYVTRMAKLGKALARLTQEEGA